MSFSTKFETAIEKAENDFERLMEEKFRAMQSNAPRLDKGNHLANHSNELEDVERALEKAQNDLERAVEKAQNELKRLTEELRLKQDKAQYPQGWAPPSYWTPSWDPEDVDLWTTQHHEIYDAEKEIFLAIAKINGRKERKDNVVQEIVRTLGIMKPQGGHHTVEWIEKSKA
ncbi:hypothetical protein BG003_000306 [Podila horticola]|nr:hypothetical protein BG003_000306 [Podila horticola]